MTKVAMQGAFIGSIGLSSFVFRTMWNNGKNTIYEETQYLKTDVGLCTALDGIKELECDDEFNVILRELDAMFAMIYTNNSLATQWNVNRTIHRITENIKKMCDRQKRSTDVKILTACVHCEQDHIPAIEARLQDIMYNYLLDHSATL